MGINGMVYCRCYVKGMTERPPHEEHVKVSEEDGGLVFLDLEYEGNEEKHAAFSDWEETACPHEDMIYSSDRVGNMAGMGLLDRTLEALGFKDSHIYNEVGGRLTSPEVAAKILVEIENLHKVSASSSTARLVNTETGEQYYNHAGLPGGIFSRLGSTGIVIGFNNDGLFIRGKEGDEKATFFHAPRFEIRVGGSEVHLALREESDSRSSARVAVEYVALDSDQRYTFETDDPPAFLPFSLRNVHPGTYRLHVESRRLQVKDIEFQLEAIKGLCRDSIEEGNGITWG
ncbi:hypothetical protein ACFL2Q_18160 [Thermodesulfobacteriota bacterium]